MSAGSLTATSIESSLSFGLTVGLRVADSSWSIYNVDELLSYDELFVPLASSTNSTSIFEYGILTVKVCAQV